MACTRGRRGMEGVVRGLHYYRRRKQTERGGRGGSRGETVEQGEGVRGGREGQVSAREAEPRECRRAWEEVVLVGNVISPWRANQVPRGAPGPASTQSSNTRAPPCSPPARHARMPVRLFTCSPVHLLIHLSTYPPIHPSTLCSNTAPALHPCLHPPPRPTPHAETSTFSCSRLPAMSRLLMFMSRSPA
jgi:hypothetical protein